MADFPIFIVGTSRSGTNLTRAIMNRHDSLWISGETHYFDDLRLRLGQDPRAPLSDEARKRCEDYFLALEHRPYGQKGDPSESRLDVGQLRTVAGELGGHADAYFEAFCTLRATREGKRRWGEKTPRHVYRLDDLLTAFPTGKVVCLVRDPRAVAASYRDWHSHERGKDKDSEDREALDSDRDRARRSYDPLLMSLLWRSTVRAAYDAQRRFGSDRVHVQPYESLLVSPEGTLREMCEWLELEYQSAMVDVPVVNSSYGEWHGPPQGISQEPLDRWRLTLPPTDVAVIQSAAGRLMDGLGYERENVRAGRTRVAAKWVTLPYVGARVVVLNRDRLGKTGNYLKRRVSLAFSRESLSSE
jgi:hypothetical protein